MKKKVLFVLAIILVAVLCVSVWYYGYYNRKSNDNIPSKELMVFYYQNKGADYATEQLQGYKNTQLMEVWGEPDSCLSGMWGDIWETYTNPMAGINAKNRIRNPQWVIWKISKCQSVS